MHVILLSTFPSSAVGAGIGCITPTFLPSLVRVSRWVDWKLVNEHRASQILHYAANPEEAQAQFQAVTDRFLQSPASQPTAAHAGAASEQDSASAVSTSADIGSGSGQVRQRRAATPGHVELTSLSDSSSSTLQSPAFA